MKFEAAPCSGGTMRPASSMDRSGHRVLALRRAMRVTVVALLLAGGTAVAAEKSIPQLIADFAVKDAGDRTRNTAALRIIEKKDQAVPALREALAHDNETVRHEAIRCLAQINTAAARASLIDAVNHGPRNIRRPAANALAWYPAQDAEEIYIEAIDTADWFGARRFIHALGEIRSKRAIPRLSEVRSNPGGWEVYYAAVVALRQIESRELPAEVQAALETIRKGKYQLMDAKKLAAAEQTIKAAGESCLPDVFAAYLWQTKGNLSRQEPNAQTILRDAGRLARPYILIGLADADSNVRRETVALIEELRWQTDYAGELPSAGHPARKASTQKTLWH